MSHGSAISLTLLSTGSCRTAAKNGALRIKARPATERRGKIKAETVDVEGFDPQPQRIHHHLQHARMRELQRIAGAGEILVVARLVGQQPVIGGIVDAPVTQRGAHMVALARVVVDNIQDHLDARIMQRCDSRAEIGDRVAGSVARLGYKEAERVVAPVIPQAALDEIAVIEKGMDGQEFDRADAELLQMRDRPGLRQSAKRAARFRGDIVALLREAFAHAPRR